MARAGFKIKGAKKVMKNLGKEIKAIENRTHAGLIDAVITLQRAAEQTVPIDTSNLRHSWFAVSYKGGGNQTPVQGSFKGPGASKMKGDHAKVIQVSQAVAKKLGSDKKPVLIFGYSANYAAFVHENVEATFERPEAEARWLIKAIQEKKAEMLEDIRRRARIR